MKNLFTLIAFLCLGVILYAQDPVFNQEEETPETVCEPYLAASYDHAAQTLTIRYEDCHQDMVFWGWCGTGLPECGFGELNRNGDPVGSDRHLVVGNLQGTIHYAETFGLYQEMPEMITVSQLNLNPGIYFVRLQSYREGEKVDYLIKFPVN